jgi:hypothetical protein
MHTQHACVACVAHNAHATRHELARVPGQLADCRGGGDGCDVGLTFFVALPLCRALFLPCMTESELCMAELFDTRCFDCKKQIYQCSGCQKLDKGRKAELRLSLKSKKTAATGPQAPLVSHLAAPDIHPAFDSAQPGPETPATPASDTTVATAPPFTMQPTRLADAIHSSSSESLDSCGIPKVKGLSFAPKKKRARKSLKPFPAEQSDAEDVAKSSVTAVKGSKAKAPKKTKKAAPPPPKSDASGSSDSSSCDGDDEDEEGGGAVKKKGKSMPRISVKERHYVEKWIKKTRHDGSMTNGRWIRNGGAKGQTMTATSGEVKTNGAHDALAAYLNKNMGYNIKDPLFWTRDVSKKRWTALYKSYKDATLLTSKGNSTAGTTQAEIESAKCSVLAMQVKKCPSFRTFDSLFANHPTVKPVNPQEVGAVGAQALQDTPPLFADEEKEGKDDETRSKATKDGEAAKPAGAAAGGEPKGKAPAPPPFHMAPSKKSPKMDLGEAYLKAQQLRIESVAASSSAKMRLDLICTLSAQQKTAAEIEAFLKLLPQ